MLIRKGAYCFIDDENGEPTSTSVSMDKDRELNIGDIFTWNEDLKSHFHNKFKVVNFSSFMPVLIDFNE